MKDAMLTATELETMIESIRQMEKRLGTLCDSRLPVPSSPSRFPLEDARNWIKKIRDFAIVSEWERTR